MKLPKIYVINGQNLVQIKSTPKSGLFRFVPADVNERDEIILLEKQEIPKHYLSDVESFEN